MFRIVNRLALSLTLKRAAVAALLGVILVLPLPSVSAQSSIFPLDVWTEKGGEGTDISGGAYAVGEIITIWLHVGLDSYVSWTVMGPAGSEVDSANLPAGTYSLDLKMAEVSDIGRWVFDVQAMSGSIVAVDSVAFDVVAEAPSTPPPPTSGGVTQPPVAPSSALSQDSATVLDALIALKMAQGSMPLDLNYDADGDGQVTPDDARLILRWSVQ
ncbi:MAG: hypothetical protein GX600_03510 [Dehalococcoidia bacterium]|nr:hypothetical protein [Dehalococcoidia bacterium]